MNNKSLKKPFGIVCISMIWKKEATIFEAKAKENEYFERVGIMKQSEVVLPCVMKTQTIVLRRSP